MNNCFSLSGSTQKSSWKLWIMNKNSYIIFLSKYKQTNNFANFKTLSDINVSDTNYVTSEIKDDKSYSGRSIY